MNAVWMLYLQLSDIWTGLGERYRRLSAQPEAGDMNISKAAYAALAVGLAVLLTGAITAAVTSRVTQIEAPAP